MRHINWSDVVRELRFGNWGNQGETVTDLIKSADHKILQTALLVEISKDLSALRVILNCSHFQQIPQTLRKIQRNTEKRKRKLNLTNRG